MHLHDPVVVAVNAHAVVGNVVGEAALAVHRGVEAVARMGGNELQRKALDQLLRMRTFPRRHIPVHHRSLGVVGVGPFEPLGDELDLAAGRLQALAVHARILGRQWLSLWNVLGPAFGKPAEIHGRLQTRLLRRHDKVALLAEVCPRNVPGHVRGVEDALAPVQLGATFGEQGAQPQPLQDQAEDFIVTLGLTQWLNALVLHGNQPVVQAVGPVLHQPATGSPFANVVALELGAGGQNHIGELRFTLHPDRLVDDELDALVPVGLDHARRLGQRAEEGSAVLVDHVHPRVPGRRIADRHELELGRHAVPGVTHGLPLDDGFRELLFGNHLPHGVHCEHMRHALVVVDRVAVELQVA